MYDFIEEPGRAWLVSEYVDGASLRKILDRSGFLAPEFSRAPSPGLRMATRWGCSMAGTSTCAPTPLDGSAFTSPPGQAGSTCTVAAGRNLKFYEKYDYTDPGPGGNPIPVTVHWQGVRPDASLDPETNYISITAMPSMSGTHQPTLSYHDTHMDGQPAGSGYVYFNLTWTNPDGTAGTFSTLPTRMYYAC